MKSAAGKDKADSYSLAEAPCFGCSSGMIISKKRDKRGLGKRLSTSPVELATAKRRDDGSMKVRK